MTIDIEKAAQDTLKVIGEKINNLNMLNIIVAGKTGVGKSFLINSVFRDKLAETGMGRPVTEHMRKISKKGVPLTIYDTRGFELGKEVQQQVKKEVMDAIKRGYESKDINKAIHCIWYCINTASNRVEPEEIEWLRELSKENQIMQIPIIIVLTQSFSKKNADLMRGMLLKENLDVVQIVPVLAEDYEIDDDYVAKSYGLDVLIQIMGEALPEELIETLQNVQIASLAEKKRWAHKAVATATLTATAEAAAPIPFADSFILIPIQVAMIASITVIFGFDVNKSVVTAYLSATLGSTGATLLGKTIFAGLSKMFTGGGSVVGGVISAATAGTITAALGEAYIRIMELVFKGDMKIEDIATDKGKSKIVAFFEEELKHRFKKKGLRKAQAGAEDAQSEDERMEAVWMDDDALIEGEGLDDAIHENGGKYVDLHLHLDGAITPGIARALATMQGIPLPESEEELKGMIVVPADCKSLNDFLKCFAFPLSLMQTREGLKEAVRLVADQVQSQGVAYAEIRFAPQLHTDKGMTQEEAVLAALEGMKESTLKCNLILCCMRGKGNEACNEETLMLAKKYLVEDGGVVAMDLAGAEALFPTADYRELFAKAAESGIPFTIHAGEADGANSVLLAAEYGAARIGHGVRSMEDSGVVEILKQKGIVLEVCPTSNRMTHAVENMEEHPFLKLMEQGVKVTLNTDDMAIEGISLAEEFAYAKQLFELSADQERQITENAIEAAFTSKEVKEQLRQEIFGIS